MKVYKCSASVRSHAVFCSLYESHCATTELLQSDTEKPLPEDSCKNVRHGSFCASGAYAKLFPQALLRDNTVTGWLTGTS